MKKPYNRKISYNCVGFSDAFFVQIYKKSREISQENVKEHERNAAARNVCKPLTFKPFIDMIITSKQNLIRNMFEGE